MPSDSASGSAPTSPRTSSVSVPSWICPPGAMLSRASSAGSARAPNRPSRSARSSGQGRRRASVFTAPGERIIGLDRLQLGQGRAAIRGARHRPHGRDGGDLAARFQERQFLRRRLAVDQRERGIAAEDRSALARQSVAEPLRDGADARDRGHAESEAGDEDAKARQSAAHFPPRKLQRQQDARNLRCGDEGAHADKTSGAPASIRPERIRTTRSQRRASARSWVTRTSVARRSSVLAKMRSAMEWPVVSSRLPVGSSATRILGSAPAPAPGPPAAARRRKARPDNARRGR